MCKTLGSASRTKGASSWQETREDVTRPLGRGVQKKTMAMMTTNAGGDDDDDDDDVHH